MLPSLEPEGQDTGCHRSPEASGQRGLEPGIACGQGGACLMLKAQQGGEVPWLLSSELPLPGQTQRKPEGREAGKCSSARRYRGAAAGEGLGQSGNSPSVLSDPPAPTLKYLKAFKSLAGGSRLGVGKPKVLSRAGRRLGQAGECASRPKGHLLLSAVSGSPVRNAGPRPPHCSSWFLRRQKFRFLYAEGWQYISFLCVCYQR